MSTEEWLLKNSIKLNENQVARILKKYGFEVGIGTNCQITVNRYDYDICLRYMDKSYRVVIDANNKAFDLLEENKASNGRNKNRHHRIKSFFGNSVIEDILKFIKNSSINHIIAC